MKVSFWRYQEACWFECPAFDLLPFLSVIIQHKATVGANYGLTVKLGWLFWQFRLEITSEEGQKGGNNEHKGGNNEHN